MIDYTCDAKGFHTVIEFFLVVEKMNYSILNNHFGGNLGFVIHLCHWTRFRCRTLFSVSSGLEPTENGYLNVIIMNPS